VATIHDIAREAGVSQGTVSNVINGRGNVSAEKMRLVWAAIDKLGYKVNEKAQSLRGGVNRTIAVLLPGIEDKRWAEMYEVFQSEFDQKGYSVQLYSTRFMENTEKELLERASAGRVSALITSSCIDHAVEYYRREAYDIPMVFLQSSGPHYEDTMYAWFDPVKAGRDIAFDLQCRGAERICIFMGPRHLTDETLFLDGFRSITEENLTVVDCPDHQVKLRAFEIFRDEEPFDAIVCTDHSREEAVRYAQQYASSGAIPYITTVSVRSAMINPSDSIYELDYKKLAHRVVKTLYSRLEEGSRLPLTMKVDNNGFRDPVCSASGEKHRLKMLTIASPSTTALRMLIPHLKKSTGIDLELTVLPTLGHEYDQIQREGCSQYDMVRIDVAWMDELAAKIFQPLSGDVSGWNRLLQKTIPELGDQYTSLGPVKWCLPYDPSTQLLFYRRNYFENPTCKRMYFEKYREELKVPESFDEYNRVAGFFTRSLNTASPTRYGTTLGIGSVVVNPSEFIPRLFEQGGDLLDAAGRVSVFTPEAHRALGNFTETYHYADQKVYDSWDHVLEGFADGSAAMAMVFINYASQILTSKMSGIAGTLGFAPVPGGKPLLGGGVLGITKECSCPEAVYTFVSWLYSDWIAPVFTMLGGLSPCISAYTNRDINEMYPWLSSARRSFPKAKKRRSSEYYSNFSELRLEDLLSKQIKKAVVDGADIDDALKMAQRQCDQYFIRAKT
jgi:multiple sugar transport system substrate-binding protein